eukprot:gnl/Hemi2/28391_TR9387_c0_g1_i2.p1 gnl/Hemi2/28391_TR9387_c0_g1~~gnl/Hemi2/28391_TR9387_c0_g1_i2.p1  ORF type:complete len:156 (-),score=35.36 gnl/Hemi2/28391_TR9387_c0_g1_i2:77-544(-)
MSDENSAAHVLQRRALHEDHIAETREIAAVQRRMTAIARQNHSLFGVSDACARLMLLALKSHLKDTLECCVQLGCRRPSAVASSDSFLGDSTQSELDNCISVPLLLAALSVSPGLLSENLAVCYERCLNLTPAAPVPEGEGEGEGEAQQMSVWEQ